MIFRETSKGVRRDNGEARSGEALNTVSNKYY